MFFLIFVTKSLCLTSLLGKRLRSTKSCMHKHTFCLNSTKCWFCSMGTSHCEICVVVTKSMFICSYDLVLLRCLAVSMSNTKEENGQPSSCQTAYNSNSIYLVVFISKIIKNANKCSGFFYSTMVPQKVQAWPLYPCHRGCRVSLNYVEKYIVWTFSWTEMKRIFVFKLPS